jgi:hypothetical protein
MIPLKHCLVGLRRRSSMIRRLHSLALSEICQSQRAPNLPLALTFFTGDGSLAPRRRQP